MTKKYPVVSGAILLKTLIRYYGYSVISQKGSHIKIRTFLNGKHTITIPNHKELDKGTLANIIGDVARHLNLAESQIISKLK